MNFTSYHRLAGWATLLSVALVFTFTATAHALTISFDEAGYSAGDVIGQPTDGASTWVGNAATYFNVVSGIGADSSNGLSTGSISDATTYRSVEYYPATSEMNDIAFDSSSSVVAFSIDVKLAASSTNNDIMRVYIGKDRFQGSTYSINLFIQGDGDYRTSGYDPQDKLLSDNAYHTFSGVMDYATRTYSLSVDGTEKATGLSFDGSGTTYSSGWLGSGYKLNTQNITDLVNNTIYFDNIEYDVVPEPATICLMFSGGLLVYMRRKFR